MQHQDSGWKLVSKAASILFVLGVGTASAQPLAEVGFDGDDFLLSSIGVGGPAGVFVLDADLSLKGRLANSPDALATGLDFDGQGRLVARINPLNPRGALAAVFEPSGRMAPQFPDFIINSNGTLDLKVTLSDTYLAAAQDAIFGEPNGLLEFDRQGGLIRTLDVGPDYESVAVLGDGTIWAGGGSFAGFLNAFDPVTGVKTELFQVVPSGTRPPVSPPAFDGGQLAASSLTYDATTDTVLIADRLTLQVFERDTDGTLLNTFTLPEVASGNSGLLLGATRGPNGEVYAAFRSTIYRFADDGSFLDETTLGLGVSASNLVWAGNAPLFIALPGDYNGNGVVDAADYTVWQDNFGSTLNLAADGNGNGVVDAADYTVWQDQFGQGVSTQRMASIPEPGSLGLLLAVTALNVCGRRGRSRA